MRADRCEVNASGGGARWALMVDAPLGHPLPGLPDLNGRSHRMHDEPLPDEYLQGITCPLELAALRRINKFVEGERLRLAQTTT